MYHPECLPPILSFLDRIGLPIRVGPFGRDGFLPGIHVVAGVLHVDPDRLAGSGDVLHEAGHVAIVPSRYRAALGDDMAATLADAAAAMSADTPDPVLAPVLSLGEFMAVAWSWAALAELSLPPECVFFPGTYHTPPELVPHPMIAWVASGTHHGPLGLARVGMTGPSGLFAPMVPSDLPPFPHMTKWLQD